MIMMLSLMNFVSFVAGESLAKMLDTFLNTKPEAQSAFESEFFNPQNFKPGSLSLSTTSLSKHQLSDMFDKVMEANGNNVKPLLKYTPENFDDIEKESKQNQQQFYNELANMFEGLGPLR